MLKRLMWHYVDEVGRPDTMNLRFPEEFENAQPQGLSNNEENTLETYIKVFTSIFPEIEDRFIDNATRTVTTHNHPRSRNPWDNLFECRITSSDVRKVVSKDKDNQNFDEDGIHKFLFQLRDDREQRCQKLKKKIQTLKDLRSALNVKPPEFPELQSISDNVNVSIGSFMNRIQSHIHGYEG